MIVASSPLWVVEFVVTADEAVRRFRERHEATDLDEAAVRERVDNFSYWDKAYQVTSSAAGQAAVAERVSNWRQQVPVARSRRVGPRGTGMELIARRSSQSAPKRAVIGDTASGCTGEW